MGHHSFLTSELLRCSQGILFGENTPKLPAPPLLAFDEIIDIDLEGGKYVAAMPWPAGTCRRCRGSSRVTSTGIR
jgi:hypothetical protein